MMGSPGFLRMTFAQIFVGTRIKIQLRLEGHQVLGLSRGLGWRIHESVEDTKLSTNKQHTLSLSQLFGGNNLITTMFTAQIGLGKLQCEILTSRRQSGVKIASRPVVNNQRHRQTAEFGEATQASHVLDQARDHRLRAQDHPSCCGHTHSHAGGESHSSSRSLDSQAKGL